MSYIYYPDDNDKDVDEKYYDDEYPETTSDVTEDDTIYKELDDYIDECRKHGYDPLSYNK